jgi:hypothetical protein
MKPKPNYLALLQQDWEDNLAGLQKCIALAYTAARKKTDPSIDPDFSSPNKASLEGYLRWGFIDTYLARGCANGLLKGITPHWIPTTKGSGGIEALELRAKHSALIAHHLQFQEDLPRESKIRTDMRLLNQFNQLLPSFDAEQAPEESEENDPDLFHWKQARDEQLINLTLVHGNKLGEFALLRVYDRKADLSSFIPVFGNIMAQPTAVPPLEQESIDEAKLDLKDPKKKKQTGTSEDGK